MNLFNQAHTKKISQLQCPQNPSQNSFNNITYCQHYQNSMSYQHCSRLHHVNSKCPQSQDYNMINHTMPQISKIAHNNKMTMSQHQTLNEAWTKKNSQKKKKNLPWSPCGNVEHGFWGLEGSPLHHSFQVMDGIFFPMKSKERRSFGRWCHCSAKRREVWKWVSQNGNEAKMAKDRKI